MGSLLGKRKMWLVKSYLVQNGRHENIPAIIALFLMKIEIVLQIQSHIIV